MTSSTWAKSVTGYGKLGKDGKKAVQAKIKKNRPEWKFRNDNESDAIGLGVAYLMKYHGMKEGNEEQDKTDKKIKNR
jgi:hypothetical protein